MRNSTGIDDPASGRHRYLRTAPVGEGRAGIVGQDGLGYWDDPVGFPARSRMLSIADPRALGNGKLGRY